MAGKPRYKVEVKYDSSLAVSTRTFLKPITKMFSAFASRVKTRIADEQKLADGRRTGRYASLRKIDRKKVEREAAILKNQGKTKEAVRLGVLLNALDDPPKTARRNYRQSGRMWRGLKVKAQKSGRKITIAFYGSGKGRSYSWFSGGKWTKRPGRRVSNRVKAWMTMMDTDSGRAKGHREGVHLLAPTVAELDTLKTAYAKAVIPGMFTKIKDRQDQIKEVKRQSRQNKSDAKLKQKLAALLNQ